MWLCVRLCLFLPDARARAKSISLALAKKLTSNPDDRELDVLMSTGELISATLTAMALNDLGCKAISLTGPQAGIQTDNQYRKARIVKVETTRIHKELAKDHIKPYGLERTLMSIDCLPYRSVGNSVYSQADHRRPGAP